MVLNATKLRTHQVDETKLLNWSPYYMSWERGNMQITNRKKSKEESHSGVTSQFGRDVTRKSVDHHTQKSSLQNLYNLWTELLINKLLGDQNDEQRSRSSGHPCGKNQHTHKTTLEKRTSWHNKRQNLATTTIETNKLLCFSILKY